MSQYFKSGYADYFLLQSRSETVDLNTDSSLLVDISDALSERDKVKFTVHTKVSTILMFRAGVHGTFTYWAKVKRPLSVFM